MFLTLIRWLWYLNPYLLYVFIAVLFIITGKRTRMMIFLYCTILTYDVITSLCMKLGLYLHVALRSFPYLRSYVLEFINNLLIIESNLWGKPEEIPSPTLSCPLSPSG